MALHEFVDILTFFLQFFVMCLYFSIFVYLYFSVFVYLYLFLCQAQVTRFGSDLGAECPQFRSFHCSDQTQAGNKISKKMLNHIAIYDMLSEQRFVSLEFIETMLKSLPRHT